MTLDVGGLKCELRFRGSCRIWIVLIMMGISSFGAFRIVSGVDRTLRHGVNGGMEFWVPLLASCSGFLAHYSEF